MENLKHHCGVEYLSYLESLVSSLSSYGPDDCSHDAKRVCEFMNREGISGFDSSKIEGPLFHYHYQVSDLTFGIEHYVAQHNTDGTLIDLSLDPGKRVYESMGSYMTKSGIIIASRK